MTTINSTTSLSSPALVMEEGGNTTQVIVHPLVLLHVLDHHTRRQEASGRVIGTLLGRRDGKKVRNDIQIVAKTKIWPILNHVGFQIYFVLVAAGILYLYSNFDRRHCQRRSRSQTASRYLMPKEATKLPLEKISTNRCWPCIFEPIEKRQLWDGMLRLPWEMEMTRLRI